MMQTELTTRDRHRDRQPAISLLHRRETGFTVYERGAIGRRELERRIRQEFDFHFGARICNFMPELARYEDPSGATAVVGLRAASSGPLFLETYLGTPIEAVVGRVSGADVPRSRIVEVGQFVVDDRAAVAGCLRDLVPFLAGRGFHWVCFTGTRLIRARLARVGLRGLELTTATEESVTPDGAHWGDYYQNEPVVTLGKLDDPRGHWLRGMDATAPSGNRAESCPQ